MGGGGGGGGGVCWVTTTVVVVDAGVGLRDLDEVEVDREADLARVCSRSR